MSAPRTFNWRFYMDWNHDDFWCRDARPGDLPNNLANALDMDAQTREAKGSATVEVTTGFGARTRYGNEYFNVTTSAVNGGINLFKNGATYSQTSTLGQTYTFVCWVRLISGMSGTDVLRVRIRSNSDSVTEATKDYTSSDLPLSQWTRIEIAYTASASNNFLVQLFTANATTVNFYVTGLMVFRNATPAPLGFNTGDMPLEGYDNISADVRRASWMLGFRQPYQEVCDDQTASLMVINGDQKYTPENDTSPIYGSLTKGRLITIEWEQDRHSFDQMYVGRCDFASIRWTPDQLAGLTDVTIPFTWYTKMMKTSQIDLSLYTDTTADVVLRDVVNEVISPSVATNAIETALTTIPFYGDVVTNAWNVIVDMVSAERGRFFVARDGRATFWNRHHLLTSDYTDVDATITTGGAYKPKAIDYRYGALYSNRVRIRANPRQTATDETLWDLDSNITIPAGDIHEFYVVLRRSSGQYAASGSLSLSGATYTTGTTTNSITAYGGRAKITLDNSAGAVDALLTALTVTGAPQVQQNALEYVAEDSSDAVYADGYGWHEININMVGANTLNAIIDVATFELYRRHNITGDLLSISYKNKSDGVANYHQWQWRVGTRLAIDFTELYHTREYFIIGESHSVDITTGEFHETTFYLEPAQGFDYWLIGVSGASEIGTTTWLGY